MFVQYGVEFWLQGYENLHNFFSHLFFHFQNDFLFYSPYSGCFEGYLEKSKTGWKNLKSS